MTEDMEMERNMLELLRGSLLLKMLLWRRIFTMLHKGSTYVEWKGRVCTTIHAPVSFHFLLMSALPDLLKLVRNSFILLS